MQYTIDIISPTTHTVEATRKFKCYRAQIFDLVLDESQQWPGRKINIYEFDDKGLPVSQSEMWIRDLTYTHKLTP